MLNVYLENLVQKLGKGGPTGLRKWAKRCTQPITVRWGDKKMPKNFKSHLEAIILKGCDLKKGSHVYFSNVTE